MHCMSYPVQCSVMSITSNCGLREPYAVTSSVPVRDMPLPYVMCVENFSFRKQYKVAGREMACRPAMFCVMRQRLLTSLLSYLGENGSLSLGSEQQPTSERVELVHASRTEHCAYQSWVVDENISAALLGTSDGEYWRSLPELWARLTAPIPLVSSFWACPRSGQVPGLGCVPASVMWLRWQSLRSV